MVRDQKKNKASQVSVKGVKATTKQTPVAQNKSVVIPQKNSSVATTQPQWPTWPTSQPGPRAKVAPAGTQSFNAYRPEQVSSVADSKLVGTIVNHQ
ncbi:hypothetical protein [Dictyobacter arantiisoli]|uniref:Uncharacterized protein n=1 Tax=Dictyobacter arantiisoli TaxID=2014874 RepID=A0A5A5TJQ1_9CHLR|nr:hypothetical protein [Dictyobacter arantiisoli]GCF11830.1 hypothetical protein KDI_53940 [Dictyobacter arantiisoli]